MKSVPHGGRTSRKRDGRMVRRTDVGEGTEGLESRL